MASSPPKEPHLEQLEVGRRAETEPSLRDTLRYYQPAVIWSVLISLTTVMESYDMQIVHSFYAFPHFQREYGVQLKNGEYSIPAKWQLALNCASLLGLMSGTFLNGWASERFGARKVIMISLIALTAFVAITFVSPSVEVLFVGELL
jgi:SP family general alpha glucoside:H+ symporter-like MFS transporter